MFLYFDVAHNMSKSDWWNHLYERPTNFSDWGVLYSALDSLYTSSCIFPSNISISYKISTVNIPSNVAAPLVSEIINGEEHCFVFRFRYTIHNIKVLSKPLNTHILVYLLYMVVVYLFKRWHIEDKTKSSVPRHTSILMNEINYFIDKIKHQQHFIILFHFANAHSNT